MIASGQNFDAITQSIYLWLLDQYRIVQILSLIVLIFLKIKFTLKSKTSTKATSVPWYMCLSILWSNLVVVYK